MDNPQPENSSNHRKCVTTIEITKTFSYYNNATYKHNYYIGTYFMSCDLLQKFRGAIDRPLSFGEFLVFFLH